MRNYVKGYGMRWTGHTIAGDYALVAVAHSEEALKSQIADINAQTEADAAPNDVTFEYESLSTFYFLLDAVGVCRLMGNLGYAAWDAAALYGSKTGTTAYLDTIMNPKESPRYTGWTGADGQKHEPPPTDKAGIKQRGNVISSTIYQLGFLASKLILAGQAVLAQRVADMINQIIQKQSVDPVALNKLFDAIDQVLR